MDGWSGAEIKACCRIAATMRTNLSKAKNFIKPIGRIAKDSLAYLDQAVKEDRFNLADEVLKDVDFD